jgi:hypothetical protein
MAMDKPNAVRPAYSGGFQIHRVGPGRKLASFHANGPGQSAFRRKCEVQSLK